MSIRIAVEVAVLVWLVVCAAFDLRKREVPDWLTLPAVGLALAWQVVHPAGWMPWVLMGVTVALTLAGVLPGGDMKGLVALALYDPRMHLFAWAGAALAWPVWWLVRRERRIPGYVGFVLGAVGWLGLGLA